MFVAQPGLFLFSCLDACLRPSSRQDGHHSGPVVIPGQEIKDGVDTAVDARQRPGDLVRKVDDVEVFTVTA